MTAATVPDDVSSILARVMFARRSYNHQSQARVLDCISTKQSTGIPEISTTVITRDCCLFNRLDIQLRQSAGSYVV